MTLAVDPHALDGAGTTVISTADHVGSVLSTLTGALSGSASMCANDPVGAAMGRSYDKTAQSLLQAMATARNGLANIGDGVRVSAYNYARANASADVSGRTEPLPAPTLTSRISSSAPPPAVGAGPDAPAGWGWVEKYIGMIWPNGDPAKLRAAGAAWTTAGTALLSTEVAVAGPMSVVSAQQIPEAEAMGAAFGNSLRAASQIMGHATTLAGGLDRYATHVEATHAAIIDLLARICDPMTGMKEVWEFLTQEDEDEIARIAADIKKVVANFEAETAALASEMAPVVAEAAHTVTDMGRWVDKEWKHFLEDTTAGQELNGMGQTAKGIGEEAVDLVKDAWKYSPQRAVLDPQGSTEDYTNLVKGMAPLVGAGGDGAPGIGETWKQVGKETLHWDLWKENPAEALGRSLFDVATFFVPGGAATKLGKVGTGAAHVAEETAANAPRALDAAAHAVDEIPTASVVPHVEAPAVKPGEPVALPRPGETSEPAAVPKPVDPVPRPIDGLGSTGPKPVEQRSLSPSDTGLDPVLTEQQPTSVAASPRDAATSVPTNFAAELPVVSDAARDFAPKPGDAVLTSSYVGAAHELAPESAYAASSLSEDVPAADKLAHVGGGEHGAGGDGGGDHSGGLGGDGHRGSAVEHGNGTTVDDPSTERPATTEHEFWTGSSDGDANPSHSEPTEGRDYAFSPQHALENLHYPEGEIERLRDAGVPARLLEGYDPLAGRSIEEIQREFTVVDGDGRLRWDWDSQAPSNGFDSPPAVTDRFFEGQVLDRLGSDGGGFMAGEGAPLSTRGMPPGMASDYRVYVGTGQPVPEGLPWEVRYGPAREAFGQPGGAEQWVVIDVTKGQPVPVRELIDRGMLIKVHQPPNVEGRTIDRHG